jgi:putative proteasome-type protease
MTYCVAIQVEQGLVFAADSRTNAGVDYVTRYRKMHVFDTVPDRLVVVLSAGNLATTQELLALARCDLEDQTSGSLGTAHHLFEVARYFGRLSLRVQEEHLPALSRSGVSGEVSLIVGGQIQGQPPGLFLVYPQGNFIEASPETPFLQIGESKYGKPMLDRFSTIGLSLEDAGRLALVSLDATIRSNITVGPPFDLAFYRSGELRIACQLELEPSDPYYEAYRERWQRGLADAFRALPRFDWENPPG